MQAPWSEVHERREYSMNGRILLLVVAAFLALALFAPAAIAQDDDDDDDYGAATATASPTATAASTATAYADDDDDDDDGSVAAATGGLLPRTGGPALVAPIAGALLIAGGVAGGVVLRRSRNYQDDS
jgi:hypothetical protein